MLRVCVVRRGRSSMCRRRCIACGSHVTRPRRCMRCETMSNQTRSRKVQMQLCHFLTRFATAIQRSATSDGAHQPLAPIRNVIHPAWRPGAPLCLRTPGWIVWIVKLFNDPVRRAAQALFLTVRTAYWIVWIVKLYKKGILIF